MTFESPTLILCPQAHSLRWMGCLMSNSHLFAGLNSFSCIRHPQRMRGSILGSLFFWIPRFRGECRKKGVSKAISLPLGAPIPRFAGNTVPIRRWCSYKTCNHYLSPFQGFGVLVCHFPRTLPRLSHFTLLGKTKGAKKGCFCIPS